MILQLLIPAFILYAAGFVIGSLVTWVERDESNVIVIFGGGLIWPYFLYCKIARDVKAFTGLPDRRNTKTVATAKTDKALRSPKDLGLYD